MVKKITYGLAITALLIVALWLLSRSKDFQLFGDIVSRVETKDKVVALTFDDGPWNSHDTKQVLETLKRHDVKATFYLNGSGIESNFQATQDIVKGGHEIGNHGYSHDRLVFKSLETITREIDSTSELIRSAGYLGELTFRPPYGKKLFVLPYYLDKQNMTSITWDVEPEKNADDINSAASIAHHAIVNTKPGSIILLHPMGSQNEKTRLSIAAIIENLKQLGFEFVTVSELLERQT